MPDERTAGFWEAAARHRLAIARCGQCGFFAHPPDAVCCACGSTEPQFAFEEVSGRGRIRSWTVVRQALLPGFADDVPFKLVDVELDEQPELRLVGRLTDGLDAPIAPGDRVAACFEDIAPGIAVPAFRLDRR